MLRVRKNVFDKNPFRDHNSVKSRCIKRILKLSWMFAILLSISGLAFYTNQAYRKWHVAPDISMTIKQISSRLIPLPAITICHPYFPTQLKLPIHPIEYVRNVYKQKIESKMTAEQQSLMAVAMQICQSEEIKTVRKICENRSDTNFFNVLFKAKFPYYIHNCEFRAHFIYKNCDRIITKSLTEFGLCETFNMQGYNAIFNIGILSNDFDFYKRSSLAKFPYGRSPKFKKRLNFNDSTEWTLEEGYKTNEDETLPVRAIKRNSFGILIRTSVETWLCRQNGVGFQLFFHLPSEIPTTFSEHKFIPYKHEMKISVNANLFKSSSDMKNYSPVVRRCYYEGEKKLQFFKTYTKSLCDFECLTNYTLKHCGCVKFSMPRAKRTKICDLDQLSCLNEAILSWPNVDDEKALTDGSATCNCLESCTKIQYIATTDRNYPNNEETNSTSLRVSFDMHSIEEHTSFIAYTLQNFIADCGGLIGLFLGFSLLSIVELICSSFVFISKLGKKEKHLVKISQVRRVSVPRF